ncbi:EAL domain-containing protein [Methylobacterium sp. Leaf466]|uniref:putative bifunctional diguanylate cyclase/phosphodiesterase n=1 Tax=Methylobacterium sp. Leaf466 TaxID=1736386 RepID=UPI0006F7B120|nr:EAL domain-containing protein [Methylobacterium sp. Leaf466]KQT80667.1 hypothetical protein ASG59_04350 [Methylobacterium sp. Leaf466]
MQPAIDRLRTLCGLAAETFRVPVVRLIFDDPALALLEIRMGADHPETESEREACARIRGWCTKALPPGLPSSPGLRLLARAPVAMADRGAIGSLCLFEDAHRRVSQSEKRHLADLAALVSEWPDLREEVAGEAHPPYRQILEIAQDAFVGVDSEGAIVEWNAAAEAVFGWTAAEVRGRPMAEIIIPEPLRARHAVGMARYLATGASAVVGRSRLELTALHRNGSTFPVEMAISQSGGNDRMRISAFLRDISQVKERERQIAHMAQHDALTGLTNRSRFHACLAERLERLERDGIPFALLYLDLDRLVVINETLGHRAGDAVLVEVAARLRGALRQEDVVARLGGDEFAILQIGAASQPASAAALAQRLIDAVTGPTWVEGKLVEIGLSIGIVVAPTDGRDSRTVLKRADLALARAKADGRNTRRFYETDMDAAAEAKRNLEIDLRGALSRGEFEVYYQPLVDAQNLRPSGAEALVRWRHPRVGLVSPAAFIALAEETGLIVQLGEWVMRTACLEAAGWPAHMRIAVNISAIQFRQARFVEIVMHALAETGLAPERLELEITETVLMQSLPQVVDALHLLRRLGVRISLDDFGTGYSSLSYLRKFPFDKLKIDQSFVQDLANPATASIVQAIVALGRGLGMTVTAEGVETEEQRATVTQYGCTDLQGYLFGRPGSKDDFSREHLTGCNQHAA